MTKIALSAITFQFGQTPTTIHKKLKRKRQRCNNSLLKVNIGILLKEIGEAGIPIHSFETLGEYRCTVWICVRKPIHSFWNSAQIDVQSFKICLQLSYDICRQATHKCKITEFFQKLTIDGYENNIGHIHWLPIGNFQKDICKSKFWGVFLRQGCPYCDDETESLSSCQVLINFNSIGPFTCDISSSFMSE